jgi:hypothetical protein
MTLSRRALLSAAPAAALAAAPTFAASPGFGLDAAALGLKAGGEDQSALLKRLLDRAAREQRPLLLPGGRYTVGEDG